jgi:glucokinase
MSDAVLAVDIGGTKTAVALVDRAGRVIDSARAATPALEGPGAVIDTVRRLALALIERADATPAVRGVGVATAGVVDAESGVIVSSTDTMADWAGTQVTSRVRVALSDVLPPGGLVHVQNDADAHAAGEHRYGAAVGASSVLVVAVGTGVGAGIIVDGRILRGARHVAGEIAHVPTPGAQHLLCPCGRAGHLEAIGSGVGLHRHYLAIGGDPAARDARAVVGRADAGDDVAQRAITESAAAVGRALAAAVTLIDPERVVVTGGVVDIGARWWNPMVDSFRSELIDVLQEVPVVPGALGGHAPLLGAAASAWERAEVSAA